MSERFAKYDYADDEDTHLRDIKSKISSLKAISIDIGHEVREHNSLLDKMGVEFDSAGNFLNRSMRQLKDLSKTERGRSYILYTFLFIISVLLFFYFVVI